MYTLNKKKFIEIILKATQSKTQEIQDIMADPNHAEDSQDLAYYFGEIGTWSKCIGELLDENFILESEGTNQRIGDWHSLYEAWEYAGEKDTSMLDGETLTLTGK